MFFYAKIRRDTEVVITELPRKQQAVFSGSWVRIPLSSPELYKDVENIT